MMAFFLIMWLINVTDDQVRKGISEYFNPIHLSSGQTDLKGLNEPDPSAKKPDGKAGHTDAASPAFNPVQLSQGQADTKAVVDSKGSAAPAVVATPAAAAAGPAAAPAPTPAPAALSAPASGSGSESNASAKAPLAAGAASALPAGDAKAVTAAREQAAFEDPYAVLAKLAATYSADHPSAADIVAGDERRVGITGGEVDRDPFDPVYWQLANVPPAKTEPPGKPGTAPPVPVAAPDAAASARPDPGIDAFDGTAVLEKLDGTLVVLPSAAKPAAAEVAKAAPAPPSAATVPPVAKPAPGEPRPAIAKWLAKPAPIAKPVEPTPAAATGPDAKAVAAADALKSEIAASVAKAIGSAAAPMLSVEATSEGILIDLTDDSDFTMFEVGSAIPNARVVLLMEQVAKTLAGHPGNVVVRGHTDGRPFHSELYDNWRLSAARAQMAHYMLARGGLDDRRVVRIEGYADRDLKVPADPLAAENRRIEILLQEAKP
jgi:chemotaxis protein MotB